jgi:hypothetical protein
VQLSDSTRRGRDHHRELETDSERRTGIEPASSPWKGEALPLSYRRTDETAAQSGSPTMTVCTDYVTLCYIG